MSQARRPSWALDEGELVKLDKDEELDYLEIRFQKLESKQFQVRRKAAEALAPYVRENRYIDEVRERFAIKPPHPAAVLADGLVGPDAEKNSCASGAAALAHMGPAAAPYASKALAVLCAHVDDELRWEASRAIGCLGTGAAKEGSAALAKMLDPVKEEQVLVRFTAARSLGLLGPDAAKGGAEALANALDDKDVDVRNAAAQALAQIGPSAASRSVKALVKGMLEGSFELRRLSLKALIAMGESVAGTAAYPVCRVLLRMMPCCRPGWHPMVSKRDRNKICDQCQLTGPFAMGTDYHCAMPGCQWDVCMECFRKLRHEDTGLQRLAAEACFSMGAKAVQTCQVYLSRALGDPDQEVVELCRKALEMGGCSTAIGGSMALYDVTSCPCGSATCKLCNKPKETPMLEDEKDSEEEPVDGGKDAEVESSSASSSSGLSDSGSEAALPSNDKHEDYIATPPVQEEDKEVERKPQTPEPASPEPELLEPPKPESPPRADPMPESPKPESPPKPDPAAESPRLDMPIRRRQVDPWGAPPQTATSGKPQDASDSDPDLDD